jgi:Fe-S-cluster containining protein
MDIDQEQAICLKCQKCCRYMVTKQEYEDPDKYNEKVEFLSMWGCVILRHNDGKTFECVMSMPCRWITPEGCGLYGIRPKVCRDFRGGSNSIFLSKNCELYPIRLKEHQDVEAGNNKINKD